VSFAIGSLVNARGREWVVLPESEADLLVLRPLGGTNDEVTGILPSLETVEPADRVAFHHHFASLADFGFEHRVFS